MDTSASGWANGTSSWVSGPDRGLQTPIMKEPAKMIPEDCTFFPDLSSNSVLRDTVPSSGYGNAIPPPKEVPVLKDEHLTFQPALNGKLGAKSTAAKLRAIAPSSGYGHEVVQKPKHEKKPIPKSNFEPKVTKTKQALKMRASAPSSGYGTRTPPAKAVVTPTPFRPIQIKFSGSKKGEKMIKRAPSSGYGTKTPELPGWKKAQKEADKIDRAASVRRQSSYTLLDPFANTMDEPEKEEEPGQIRDIRDDNLEPEQRPSEDDEGLYVPLAVGMRVRVIETDNKLEGELGVIVGQQRGNGRWEVKLDMDIKPPFVLDGHLLENQVNPRMFGLSLKYQEKWIPDRKLPPSPMKSQYDTQTSSTGYGTTFDPFTENKRETPEKDEEAEALKEQEAGFQVLRATPIERLFENVKEMETDEACYLTKIKRLAAKEVPSSGYGVDFPEVAAKKDLQLATPWLVAGKKGIEDIIVKPDVIPKSKLNDVVGSHGYGTVPPEPVPRKPFDFAPVWVPSSKHPTKPELDKPPARKSIPVGSQYKSSEYYP